MSVDALSDSELRTKLSEYGYPVGPVTQTTRKILLKKLKTLMESRGGGGSRHSMAARYSSDDTDDDSAANAKKKKKAPVNTRRQTLANPMPPPATAPIAPASATKSPTKKRVSRNANFDSETSDYSNTVSSVTNRTTSKSERTFVRSSKPSVDNDGLETGSDSDVVEDSQPIVVTKFGGGTAKLYNDRTSSTEADINSPKSHETNWRRTLHDNNLRANTSTPKEERYSVSLPKTSTTLDTSMDTLSRDSSKKDDILGNFKTPYLSEFTRRLSSQTTANLPSKLSLKASKYRQSSLSNSPEVKETDSNGHFTSPLRTTYPSNTNMAYVTSSLDKTRDISKAYKASTTPREDVKNNQNLISMVLVIVLALFFGVLAIVYLGLEGKSDNFPLLGSDSDIPLCSQATYDQNKPGSNCVPEENVKDTLQLIKRLHPALMKRAVAAECDGIKDPPYLSNEEIVEILTSSEMNQLKVKENLHYAHVLIFRNPKWGISLIEIPDENESPQVIDTMDKIYLTRLEGKLGVFISKPDVSLQCLVKKRILTVVSSLLIAAFGALVIIGCQKLVLAYLRYKKNTEREVFHLVNEIISMLELHHQSFATTSPGGSQESFLAINHIRDNLISPKDRKKMLGLWDKAVKFLDENESRIRREIQLVSGEEFQVWRWLPGNSTAPNSLGPNSPAPKMLKVWQGSAFETMDGSVNSLACSPTSCLKIRHMFDPDVEFQEDWEDKVKDAILEKCGEDVNILHMVINRVSREGCVYMKCKSQEDAGKAYKALHGYWFDGQLVTVRYLRLERYHERFPQAISAKFPLKPSNNQRLSLQAHYWTNSSEAN